MRRGVGSGVGRGVEWRKAEPGQGVGVKKPLDAGIQDDG